MASEASHDPDGQGEDGADPMFVIKNLDTGLEMRIDDFDRIANIATDESEHDPIHPKGRGGLIKSTKVFKNWGAAAAKTAKKAVTGIKDLSHELNMQQMLAKHKSAHSLETSPRAAPLSADLYLASPGRAAANEQLLRMSQPAESSLSLDEASERPAHSDPSASSEAGSSRQYLQASAAAAAGGSSSEAAAAVAAAGQQASPPAAAPGLLAPQASARAAAAGAGQAAGVVAAASAGPAAAAVAAAVAPPVPAGVRLVSHKRSAKHVEEVVLAQLLEGSCGVVWAMAFSRDGSFLAAAGQDRLLRVWQMTASRHRETRTNWMYDAAAAQPSPAVEPAAGQSNSAATDSQQQQQQQQLQQEQVEGQDSRSSYLSTQLQEQPADAEEQEQQQQQEQEPHQPPEKPPPPAVEFGPYVSKQPVRVYSGHSEDVLDLSWSGGRFLLTASLDKTVRLWHLSQPGCLREFCHADFVTSVQFHPVDAQRFVSGSFDGKVRVWSIPDTSVLATAQVHQDMVSAVAVSLNGARVVAGTRRGRCRFYDLADKKLEYVAQVDVRNQRGQHASGKKVTGICTVPGQPNLFLIATNDSRLRLLEGQNYNTLLKFKGHKNTSTQIRAVTSPDGCQVVCGSDDGWVYLWQRAAGVAAAPAGAGAPAAVGQRTAAGGAADKGHRGGLVAAAADQLQALAAKNAVFQAFQAFDQGVTVTAVACAPPSAFERQPSVLGAAAAGAPPPGGSGGQPGQQGTAGSSAEDGDAAPVKARQASSNSTGRMVRQLLVAGSFSGGIRVFELLVAA